MTTELNSIPKLFERSRLSWFTIGCCVLSLGLTGCSAARFLSVEKGKTEWASENNPAVRMIAIWEPAEGHGIDGMPTRGFAGQILFVGAHSRSLAVDGDVSVYVFDDVGTPQEQAKPIHRFDFSSEAWEVHRHEGSLGSTYNVFIPYTRENWIYQARCELLVRLKSQAGDLNSEMIAVNLPGPEHEETPDELAVRREQERRERRAVNSLSDEIEENYRRLQDEPELQADGRVQRRMETLGKITRRNGKTEISGADRSQDSRDRLADNRSAADDPFQDRIAQLEAQLRTLQNDRSGRDVQQAGFRGAGAAREPANRHLLADFEDSGNRPHPLGPQSRAERDIPEPSSPQFALDGPRRGLPQDTRFEQDLASEDLLQSARQPLGPGTRDPLSGFEIDDRSYSQSRQPVVRSSRMRLTSGKPVTAESAPAPSSSVRDDTSEFDLRTRSASGSSRSAEALFGSSSGRHPLLD